MAQCFRDSGVRAFSIWAAKFGPLEEVRAPHDSAFEAERARRGHWDSGPEGVRELRRCIDRQATQDCHPRHFNRIAATYPDLKMVATRPGWPGRPKRSLTVGRQNTTRRVLSPPITRCSPTNARLAATLIV